MEKAKTVRRDSFQTGNPGFNVDKLRPVYQIKLGKFQIYLGNSKYLRIICYVIYKVIRLITVSLNSQTRYDKRGDLT